MSAEHESVRFSDKSESKLANALSIADFATFDRLDQDRHSNMVESSLRLAQNTLAHEFGSLTLFDGGAQAGSPGTTDVRCVDLFNPQKACGAPESTNRPLQQNGGQGMLTTLEGLSGHSKETANPNDVTGSRTERPSPQSQNLGELFDKAVTTNDYSLIDGPLLNAARDAYRRDGAKGIQALQDRVNADSKIDGVGPLLVVHPSGFLEMHHVRQLQGDEAGAAARYTADELLAHNILARRSLDTGKMNYFQDMVPSVGYRLDRRE